MSKFYEFNQNNSGGNFVFNEQNGLTHHVVIEANTRDQASALAQDAGIYFDGVADGLDCGCCGDRWYEPWGEGTAEPMFYDVPVSKATGYKWMEEGKEICVHYLNGEKKWFGMGVKQ